MRAGPRLANGRSGGPRAILFSCPASLPLEMPIVSRREVVPLVVGAGSGGGCEAG